MTQVKTKKQILSHLPKKGYSIPEAAYVSGCGKDVLYSEINKGRLKSIKLGKRRIIRPEALDEWLVGYEIKTTHGMGFEEGDAA